MRRIASSLVIIIVAVIVILAGGDINLDELLGNPSQPSDRGGATIPDGETGRVIRIIDGDTIDVEIDGQEFRVRYVGVNTPEREEPCYQDATNANRDFVQGKTVRLVRDRSDTDQYGRLLRYIYIDDTFVNEELIRMGFAEVVRFGSDDRHYFTFRDLEREAAQQGRGCHPTGIFDDGNDTR